MMDKSKLRKADIFSGGVIFLTGLFIVSQSLQMPMKDSWGGVQNVWYVSPAIFPLFVGAMIMLLGALLVRTAIKEVGLGTIKTIGSYILSKEFLLFLKLDINQRFFVIITILLCFVFLFIPRVDFFLVAIEFLCVFISIFYLDDIRLLKKLFKFYIAQIAIYFLFITTGLESYFSSYTAYPGDILVLIFILTYCLYAVHVCKNNAGFKKKLKTSLFVAFIAPIIIGMIFKYLLLVPMPFEGMVVELLDYFWYL